MIVGLRLTGVSARVDMYASTRHFVRKKKNKKKIKKIKTKSS